MKVAAPMVSTTSVEKPGTLTSAALVHGHCAAGPKRDDGHVDLARSRPSGRPLRGSVASAAPAGRPGCSGSFETVDLIPKPDQVVSAAGNVAHSLVYGGLADLRPMPRTLIDEGTLREVYHYRPAAHVRRAGRPGAAGDAAGGPGPLLRPAPRLLAGRAPRRRRAPDVPRGVRRGLVPRPQPRDGALDRGGRPDRDPRGVRARRRSAGARRRLVARRRRSRCSPRPPTPDLPIASITALGVAVRRRARCRWSRRSGRCSTSPTVAARSPGSTRPRAAAPQPLVRWAFQLSSFQKLVTKPLAIARHLDDADYLAQIEAVDRFTDEHDRLPRPHLRPALPPAAQGQRPGRRHVRPRRPDRSRSPTSPRRCWSSPARTTGSRRSSR